MINKKKRDLILLLLLLGAAALLWGVQRLAPRASGASAHIAVGGKEVTVVSLEKDQELTIEGIDGGSNHLIIQDGQIWCDQATCPDRLCVKQGKKCLDSDTIVCLPNQMTVTITGKSLHAPSLSGPGSN